ncbi:MAG: hypothetical protein J6L23_05230 [Clostridia bacterium]|nr:hypothetical protein [Clostridia bacterium]MBQ6906727.1 hypothetical protein [Clostridia bacterium]
MVYTSGVRSDGNYRQDGFEAERQNEPREAEVFRRDRQDDHGIYDNSSRIGSGLLDGIGSLFKKLSGDDLLLIGLGLVLLLDGNKDNDLLIIVLLLLLFD